MSELSFHDLSLSHEITRLSQELVSLKARQAYSTGQIKSSNSYSIYVGHYNVYIPSVDGWPDSNIPEVAATFLFKGSLPSKTAVGRLHVEVTGASTSLTERPQEVFKGFMPTSNPNELRIGVVYRFMTWAGGVNVSLTTNMPGTFELERTYTLYLS